MNPWLCYYLSVSLAGLELLDRTNRLWLAYCGLAAAPLWLRHAGDSWLDRVSPAAARWSPMPPVHSCAAAAYSGLGVDVSRVAVANDPCWRAGCRGL